jgi:hypothetical protein
MPAGVRCGRCLIECERLRQPDCQPPQDRTRTTRQPNHFKDVMRTLCAASEMRFGHRRRQSFASSIACIGNLQDSPSIGTLETGLETNGAARRDQDYEYLYCERHDFLTCSPLSQERTVGTLLDMCYRPLVVTRRQTCRLGYSCRRSPGPPFVSEALLQSLVRQCAP